MTRATQVRYRKYGTALVFCSCQKLQRQPLLDGTIGRYNQASQILSSGSTGGFSPTLYLTAIPIGITTVSAVARDQFNVEAWHRDGVGLESNFTNAVSIDF